MNRLFILVTLTIMVSSLTFGYEIRRQDAANKIVGTWTSLDSINGDPQAVVTIKKTDNKLNGTFIFRGLTVNSQEDVVLELPITNASFDGTILSFKVTFPEPGKMVTGWELKLRNDNEGGFRIVEEDGKPVKEGPSLVMKRVGIS